MGKEAGDHRGDIFSSKNKNRTETRRTTIASHLSFDAGYTRASHNFGFSPMTRRRFTRPVCGAGMTPARMASSIRLLKRRRRMKDRSIIADETNSNKNNVARKVNL
jgi:hypothetical protein